MIRCTDADIQYFRKKDISTPAELRGDDFLERDYVKLQLEALTCMIDFSQFKDTEEEQKFTTSIFRAMVLREGDMMVVAR